MARINGSRLGVISNERELVVTSQSEINDELAVDGSEADPEESEERRNARKREWGQQYDMWLIRAARKKQAIELLLSVKYPGVTRDENLVTCIPLRIDKYMIEVSVDGHPIWLSKLHIAGTRPLGGKVKAGSGEPLSEE